MSSSNIVLWAKSEIGKGIKLMLLMINIGSPTLAEDLAKGCVSILTSQQWNYTIFQDQKHTAFYN